MQPYTRFIKELGTSVTREVGISTNELDFPKYDVNPQARIDQNRSLDYIASQNTTGHERSFLQDLGFQPNSFLHKSIENQGQQKPMRIIDIGTQFEKIEAKNQIARQNRIEMFRRGHLKTSKSQLSNKADLPKIKANQGKNQNLRFQNIPIISDQSSNSINLDIKVSQPQLLSQNKIRMVKHNRKNKLMKLSLKNLINNGNSMTGIYHTNPHTQNQSPNQISPKQSQANRSYENALQNFLTSNVPSFDYQKLLRARETTPVLTKELGQKILSQINYSKSQQSRAKYMNDQNQVIQRQAKQIPRLAELLVVKDEKLYKFQDIKTKIDRRLSMKNKESFINNYKKVINRSAYIQDYQEEIPEIPSNQDQRLSSRYFNARDTPQIYTTIKHLNHQNVQYQATFSIINDESSRSSILQDNQNSQI
ncbi:UNKNOWN [Stylonychia lemnae]|uniref:Uncharacterized protein n=1 Tax=Stylonychia lemnae TaxID=5949 RepID=A0A078AT31_STYLE|nr:UNKNOWN [Stylonychia lemnae]|eukprot:CDW84033.1 UNKNOWN [Stylonychia lemnae]